MVRLRNVLAHVRAQLWLFPALMTAAAAILAILAVTYGDAIQLEAGSTAWWLYSGDASTARNLLGALLSGLITMTSLIVSMTVVILATATSQLGPRLISYFMADREIQFVIGLFIGTTFYVIIVLRTLDDTLGPDGMPHAAVTVASALTTACLFALLFYVHKIARSVVADNLVQEVFETLRSTIADIIDEESRTNAPAASFEAMTCRAMALGCAGYIQLIDYDALLRLAHDRDLYLNIRVRAGQHVLALGAHVDICGEAPEDDDPDARAKLKKKIADAVVIGSQRTPAQDLEHGMRQLVEVGLRALSPGINDPFTASAVIDRLGAALEQILSRDLPQQFLQDKDGKVRLIVNRSDHEGLVGAAFNRIRQAGGDHPAILISLARTLQKLAESAGNMETRQALLDQVRRVEETAERGAFTPLDARDVMAAVKASREAITERPLAAPV
ncbi:MAG: DUF2254 domain-containing protein [Beijerinckiaceae bacterium]|nr:DUF2254 domain-containing protein [Beijerinckiaceae bacterium]